MFLCDGAFAVVTFFFVVKKLLVMSSPNPEYEKLHVLLSEAAKLWEKNQALVNSRNFFCLWLDSCRPRSFPIPREGLVLNRRQVVKPAGDDVARVGYFTWSEPDHCPCLVVETSEATQLVLICLAADGAVFKALPPSPHPFQDNAYGERVELMADAVAAVRARYPQLDLNRVGNGVLKEALDSLRDEADPAIFQSIQKSSAPIRRMLLQKVLGDMAADELSAQLCFDFGGDVDSGGAPASSASSASAVAPALELPPRSRWEVIQDLELLVACTRLQARREESFLLTMGGAEVLSQQPEGRSCVIRLRLPPELESLPVREGDRLTLFRHGRPRDKLGTFSLDLIDSGEVVGTIVWEDPGQTSPIDDHLCAQPRRSPLEYLARSMEALRVSVLDQEMSGQSVLRSVLGLLPLRYRQQVAPARDGLDASQATALAAGLDGDNQVVIIQGPPGTGKSAVLERLARSLCLAGKRILITAPSNTAVDNICLKLLDLPLLRHGSNREVVHPEVASRCWHGDGGAPPSLADHRGAGGGAIHASTHIGLLRSPLLASSAASDGAFDVILFDEAGMASAAEALLCLCLARRAVFFGDPQQLPPFPLAPEVWRGLSEQFGVLNREQHCLAGGSFLGWLQYHRQIPELLLRNSYRCQNPRLMRFAANLFYNAQVTTSPTAEYYHLGFRERQERYHASTLRFLNTAGLPEKQRQEQLTLSGQPGIENPLEAKLAVAVLHECRQRFPLSEITLITPYRRQAKLLRKLLRGVPPGVDRQAWNDFRHGRISTVDSFQGGESDVVIITYVRSGGKSIGFVDDPNRVNVTHTRCRREMIVIGDLDHLKAGARNRIFARMERAFRRDGVVEDMTPERLAAWLAQTPEAASEGAERENDGEPEPECGLELETTSPSPALTDEGNEAVGTETSPAPDTLAAGRRPRRKSPVAAGSGTPPEQSVPQDPPPGAGGEGGAGGAGGGAAKPRQMTFDF
jgi:hypothetical protein